jgi:Fur family ferric uptake transcriptional regulator
LSTPETRYSSHDMRETNLLEKANFRALLEAYEPDRVQDRLNVIDTFLDTEDHVTLEEVYRLLKEKDLHYDADFVRDCLKRMVEWGFAQRVEFKDQPVRYEHRHLGRHHDHLICTKCGKIIEFADEGIERLQLQIASEYGFNMLQHKLEIYGLCSECFAQRRVTMPLPMAKPGERVVVERIAGGQGSRVRLSDMGLRPGDHVEIINNNGHGRLILGRDCTRLAIGRGIAQKIMVSLDRDNSDPVCAGS